MLLVFVSAGILPQGSLANFEPVNGPGYDSPGFESVRGPGLDAEVFVCNETWVAWENTTEPHYLLFEDFNSRITIHITICKSCRDRILFFMSSTSRKMRMASEGGQSFAKIRRDKLL